MRDLGRQEAADASRVSVVVPCHNYGRFLPEAVASVQAQTRPPDEVVVVDDGSTDETPDVVRALDGVAGLRTLRRSPARGAAATFNDGVRASTGDLVVVLSADDRMSPRYLELLERALGDPAVSFAYCEARLFGAGEGVERAPSFDARELARDNFVNGSAMFRRSLFERVGGFRTDIAREDWEFWIHAVARGERGVAVEGCWLEYRRHQTGSRNTMSRWRSLADHWRMRRLHGDVVRRSDVAVWAGRTLGRRLARAHPRLGT